MKQTPLGRVEAARSALSAAEAELRAAIVDAVKAGKSQAEVGRAAGYTRGRIHQLTREAPDE
jgi:hypothetical protein